MFSEQTRRHTMKLGLFSAALAAMPSASAGPAEAASAERAEDEQAHAFDLFAGQWKVRHRVLKERLADCHDWWDYDGTQDFRLLVGGLANVDENLLHKPTGTYHGVSLRAYDAKLKAWRIWWLDERFPDTLGVPVLGTFENGAGTFLADDTLNGKPIKVRYIWSKIARDSRQWEQAFSPDGGKTWETNWYSWFTRTV